MTDEVLDPASSVIQRGKRGAPAAVAAQADVVGQIAKLVSLHDAGILTDEEFAENKAQLLDHL